MSKQITTILRRKLDDLSPHGEVDAETRRNTLKEELQYYVLNFVYHHQEYSKWIMYGGSALRIIHGLDRMSVDLDFEVTHAITKKYLERLKIEVEKYFESTYGTDSDFLAVKITSGRGLLLKFNVGDALDLGQHSKQVHVKIDLNHFVAPKTVHERRPINRDQLSFVIATYNMSALMASKIAAIFLRGTRGVGKNLYEEKGRDVYDLLWYMNKKVTPDLDYLVAKGIDVKDPRALFDMLTLQMNKVSDRNLKDDLSPLFVNKSFIEAWLKSWRESYLRLLEEYRIFTVKELDSVYIEQDIRTNTYSFVYWYSTEEGMSVRIVYNLSDYWIKFAGSSSIDVEFAYADKIEFGNIKGGSKNDLQDKLKQYVSLFYNKTEDYLKKTNRIMLGDEIITKLIRSTADDLNQKTQIVLTQASLLATELDDLLK